MTCRKLFAAPALLLLALAMVAGVDAASILESPNQLGNVVSPSSNNGSFLISSMQAVDRSGVLKPIPGPLPANQVFIVTRITGYFISSNSALNGGTVFNLGDYYRASPQITNGFGTIFETITPGIPITGLGATIFLHLASDAAKTPLTGNLNLRLIGYVANIN